jgi:hypothetical protein
MFDITKMKIYYNKIVIPDEKNRYEWIRMDTNEDII